MKLLQRLCVFPTMLLLIIATASFTLSNRSNSEKYSSSNLDVSISGTSTLHDWIMKSKQGKCDINFELGANEKITGISALNFTMDAASIKSDSKMMDKNAYKALNTKTHKTIQFVLISGTVAQSTPTSYLVKTIGNLTIAGKTKKIDLVANATSNPDDKSITISGSEKLKMSDYGVVPPTVMMGTIKTGNDITISFSAKITK